tara:strand:+ start:134 stop:475 length:342 start_codon:yes stop_codon:yes gene_type:complete
MTETKTENRHKKNRTWTDEEKETHKEEYGCEILIENGTRDECMTHNAPTDALVVYYIHNERDCYDLTRGNRTKIFDMYYDKFKMNLKAIHFGGGNIKPAMWGYKSPSKSKKRK